MPYQEGGFRRAWIALDKIRFSTNTYADAWRRKEPQPCELSVRIECDIGLSAEKDDYGDTLDYSKLNKEIRQAADSSLALSPGDFHRALEALVNAYNKQRHRIAQMRVQLRLPEALLHSAGGVTLEFYVRDLNPAPYCVVGLNGLAVPCIIGIKDRERRAKQTLVISARLQTSILAPNAEGVKLPDAWKQELAQALFERMGTSTFQTAEAAAHAVGAIVASYFTESIDGDQLMDRVTLLSVSVRKPSAMSGVGGAGVSFTYGQEMLSFETP